MTTIDRVRFSTDYPFQHPSADEITAFAHNLDSDDDRERFMSGNAASLFGLELAASA